MTRTVADAAVTLDATVGFDPKDPVTATSNGKVPQSYTEFLDPNGLQGARIGVVRDLFGQDSNPEAANVNNVVNQAIEDMKGLGAEIVDSVTISNLNQILAYPSLSGFEFKFNLNDYLAEQPNAPVRTLEEIIASGGYLLSNEATLRTRNNRESLENDPEYLNIIQNRPELAQQAILAAIEENDLDALIYPTSTQPPALLEGSTATGSANRLSPFSGFPGITVPAGFTPEGLPVGIEFLGEAFSEATLLKLTYAYEQGTLNRLPPTTTPSLPGEVFEYEPVPEPSPVSGVTVVGLVALSLQLKQRWQVRN